MASAETKEKSVWTLVWRIENFSFWDRECHGEKIISPKFSMRECQWYLHLFPKGKEERDQHLHVQFHPNIWLQNVIVECELSFLDGNGSALTTGIIRNKKIKKDTPLDLPDCPTQEEVFQSKRSSFLPRDILTVRCRLWRSDLKPLICRHLSARSWIDVRGAFILFRPGFLRTLQLDQENIFRVLLNVSPSVNKFLQCTYSLAGSSLGNAHINFQISTTNNNDPVLITCKQSLLNTERETIKCIEDKHMFKRSIHPQNWYFPFFLSRQELLENNDIDSICTKIIASNISEISESDFCGVEMECDFERHNVATTSEACIQTTRQNGDQPGSSQQRSDCVTILGEDLLTIIYKDQTLSDFQLLSGDVSFPVHKNVLSARSPVFRAMFCGGNDMREVHSTSLDVPDLDAHTLNRLLTFLYAGTVDNLQWEGAAKLYYAADKYEVLSLKQKCSSVLRSSIRMSNVCDILALADRHQDEELTSFVHDFFLNHFDEILLSDEWGTFLETDSYLAGITVWHVYKRKLKIKK